MIVNISDLIHSYYEKKLKKEKIVNISHKDFWTQILHANFFFAKMLQKVFLITCMLMKINLKVIISLQINYNLN